MQSFVPVGGYLNLILPKQIVIDRNPFKKGSDDIWDFQYLEITKTGKNDPITGLFIVKTDKKDVPRKSYITPDSFNMDVKGSSGYPGTP